MAGERLHFNGWREISPVCTAPAFRGRGLASRLVRTLVAEIHGRHERAFLAVLSTNTTAIRVYEQLGFSVRTTRTLAVMTHDSASGRSQGRGPEVVALVEIVDQARVGRLPAPVVRGQRARGRAVGARKPASQPKCSAAASGEMATTGSSRWRPITSAMSRIGTPSSATACSVDPAGASPARGGTGARNRAGAPRASG